MRIPHLAQYVAIYGFSRGVWGASNDELCEVEVVLSGAGRNPKLWRNPMAQWDAGQPDDHLMRE